MFVRVRVPFVLLLCFSLHSPTYVSSVLRSRVQMLLENRCVFYILSSNSGDDILLNSTSGFDDEALHDLNRILQINANHMEALLHRSEIHRRAGRIDLSKKDIARARSIDPEATVSFLAAVAEDEEGEEEEEEEEADGGIEEGKKEQGARNGAHATSTTTTSAATTTTTASSIAASRKNQVQGGRSGNSNSNSKRRRGKRGGGVGVVGGGRGAPPPKQLPVGTTA